MRLDCAFFSAVVPDAVFVGKRAHVGNPWVIDSRQVTPGSTFVALRGNTLDGHDFIADAVARGAVTVLVAEERRSCLETLSPTVQEKVCFIIVPHVYEAVVAVARAWRSQFSLPVVGVTGSIGKTTTKELIAAMVRKSGKNPLVSAGNYNTVLGAALTLLTLTPEHHCAILEMGISRRGEMAQLADLIMPTMGVITQIAHQHMDGLGSLPDIASEKRMIFKNFKPDNIGVVFGDQPLLGGVAYSHPVVKFGCKMTNQVQARRVLLSQAQLSCVLKLYDERHSLILPTVHRGWLMSALASSAVAYFLDVPSSCIIEAIQTMPPVRSRFQPVPLKRFKGTIIDDAYNANPESMKEAILAFDRLDLSGKKIAVLGDMLALGANSEFWHRQLGRFLRKTTSIDRVVFVGENIKAAVKTVPRWVECETVSSWQEALTRVEDLLSEESAVLFKASHDIGLYKIVEHLSV